MEKQQVVIAGKVDPWKGVACPECGRAPPVSHWTRPELRELALHGPGKNGSLFCEGSGYSVRQETVALA